MLFEAAAADVMQLVAGRHRRAAKKTKKKYPERSPSADKKRRRQVQRSTGADRERLTSHSTRDATEPVFDSAVEVGEF